MENIEKIIHNTREEYKEEVLKLKEEGWEIEKETRVYSRFKNNFPQLMETSTCYLRAAMLPDYMEVYFNPKSQD